MESGSGLRKRNAVGKSKRLSCLPFPGQIVSNSCQAHHRPREENRNNCSGLLGQPLCPPPHLETFFSMVLAPL